MVRRFLSRSKQPHPTALLALGTGIFAACLLGIVSRPDNMLSTFWPTNALLLGWLLRQRRLAGPLGWATAAIAYTSADLLTGSGLELTLHMTAANLAGVATGYLLLRRNPHFNRLLLGPASVLVLFLACVAASLASALVALPSLSFLLGGNLVQALGYWFSAELVCHVTLLPVVLLAGPGQALLHGSPPGLQRWAPLLTVLASGVLALLVGGPGALVFTVPALLWCALAYPPLLTSVITLCVCVGTLLAIALGTLELGIDATDLGMIISLRLGVALLALAPLVVAAMTAARERILKALHHAANHDALTAVLSRAGFFGRVGERLTAPDAERDTSAMMLDVDFFKQINDRHGHAAGDRVLAEVAQRLRTALPEDALLGRVGGEEFAVLLPGRPPRQAQALAEQLRLRINEAPFELQAGLPPLAVSISVGVATLGDDDDPHIDTLLHRADQALYRAKAGGRDRVVVDY
jgi:diguanylate cyclase (GGDEF)-like protein